MHRCSESAGTFTVAFQFLSREDGQPVTEGMTYTLDVHEDVVADIGGARIVVEDVPRISNEKPWSGELCKHELARLKMLPGLDFNLSYRFTVTPAKR